MMRKFLCALLALGGQFALARNTIPTARLDWFHSAGHFHSLAAGVAQSGDSWVEKVGANLYQFQEVTRNFEYVEIKSPERGVTVRLYKDHADVKFFTETEFHQAYVGAWDTRRIFYGGAPGQRPYFQQIQNDDWWFMPAGTNGPLRFSTIERTNDKVVIQGHGRKYWLFDNSVMYQDGDNGPTEVFFFEGYWDELSPVN